MRRPNFFLFFVGYARRNLDGRDEIAKSAHSSVFLGESVREPLLIIQKSYNLKV